MIIGGKQRFFHVSDLIFLCMIVVAMYLLTPRFWEPAAETWKYWMAARVMKDTGGFPILSHGPLYVAYLQFFLLFDFPLSLYMENFVTHFFCYAAIFFLLKSMIPRIPALLLVCAWIPIIATIEGSATVAGMGFIALYLYKMSNAHGKNGIAPPSLGAAALCHSSYIPFFIGHVFGSVLELWKGRRSQKETWKGLTLSGWMINAVLLIVLLITLLFPSGRWDNNYMQMDQKYAPVPLTDPLTVGFFMVGNHRHLMRNEPKAQWINGDWYLTHEKTYAGATTILQAIVYKPLLVAKNILDSLKPAVYLPLFFIFGDDLSSKFGGFWLAVLSWVILFLGFYGMIRRFIATSYIPLTCAITIGVTAVFVALSLVWFTVRYQIVLLPVMFFIFSHVGLGCQSVEKLIPQSIRDKYIQPVSGKRSSKFKILLFCGVLILLAGFFLNEITLACLIPVSNPLLHSRLFSQLVIFTAELVMIFTGVFILTKADPAFFSNVARNIFRRSSTAVSVLAVVMIGTAFYSNVQAAGIQNVLSTQYLLNGSKPISIVKAHQELMINLDQQTKVLSLHETWIKAFANVNLDNVYHLYSLPPFPDSSGETDRSLNELNMILVSYNWPNAETSIATQSYLRYHLHVEPFLKKALSRGWIVKNIEGYGKMYLKTSEDHQINR
jgi:hypothetical protein